MCNLERTFNAVNMKVNKYINHGGGSERYVGVAICVRTSHRVYE